MPHVQIRNVPPKVHATLKKRAKKKGLSLSEYLLQEVTELAEQPTLDEALERIRKRPRVALESDPAELLREAREERDAQIERAVRGRR